MAFARRRADVVAATTGLALLVACGLVVRDGAVSEPERRVFEAINGLPSWLEPATHTAQFLGVLAVGPVVALAALAARRWRLAVAALLVTAGKLAAERAVWQLVHRERPGTTEPDAIVRGGTPVVGVSFVSGHVVLTSALAWILTPYLRGPWRIAPWLVVALVGFARIYLGAHNPLDVAGGLGLGVAVGAAANLLVKTPEAPSSPAPDTGRPGRKAPAAAAG